MTSQARMIMKRSPRRAISARTFLLLAVLTPLLSQCAPTRISPVVAVFDLPSPPPAPLDMAVHYSEEFQSHETVRGKMVVPIGESSTHLFQNLMPRVFKAASPLSEFESPAAEALPFDGIVEPILDAFAFQVGLDADDPRFGVTYRFTFYNARAVPAASWTVRGSEPQPWSATPVSAMTSNLRAAGTQWLQQFQPASDGQPSPFAATEAAIRGAKLVSPPANPPEIGVESVGSQDAQVVLFGAPTAKAGIFTVRVTITARDGSRPAVLPWAARLMFPSGHTVAPSSSAMALSRLEASDAAGAAIGAFVPIVGALVTVGQDSARQQDRFQREAGLRGQELPERRLEPGSAVTGYLHFIPAGGAPLYGETALRLWFGEPGGAVYFVDTPVPSLLP